MDQQKEFYFVDLFAGCGGMSLGLEKAGFHPVFVNELNEDAMKTYLVNRRATASWLEKEKLFANDINDVDFSDVKERVAKILVELGGKGRRLDLVVGGPPCQGFSGIGHRRSYSVDKKDLPSNHLFRRMVDAITHLQPKMFLFENVRGLLNARWTAGSTKKGEVWEAVQKAFRIPGYVVRSELVFAKEYGVPQNRPRVLLVGIREELAKGLPLDASSTSARACGLLPLPLERKPPDPVEVLGDLAEPDSAAIHAGSAYKFPQPQNEFQRYCREKAPGAQEADRGILADHERSRHNATVTTRFEWLIEKTMNPDAPRPDGIIETRKFAQRALPERWPQTGPSITTTSLPDDYVHYRQPRTLTVREWARFQTFPDWYHFEGKRTTGGIRRAGNPREGIFDRELPKYTQIGNAVPVWMALEIGRHFAAILTSSGMVLSELEQKPARRTRANGRAKK